MPESFGPLGLPESESGTRALSREHWGVESPSAATGEQKAGFVEYLVLILAGEPYAIELGSVQEIVNLPPVTEVPRSAADILGVCSVRGLLVTIVDLRKRLGLAARGLQRGARILLTQSQAREDIGLLVDEVREVVKLSQSEMQPVSEMLAEPSPHIRGVFQLSGHVVIVLNHQSVSG